MEEIVQDMKELSIRDSKKYTNITGIVYHKDTLLHNTDEKILQENDSSKKKHLHFESPYRILKTLERIEKVYLEDDIEKLNQFDEVDDELILSTHGEEYFSLFNSEMEKASKVEKTLWDDEDTYYNKHTKRAAKLAA